MKKINVSFAIDPIRQPLLARSLTHLQEAYTQIVNAIYSNLANNPSALSGVTVLYGCRNTGSGLNFIIAAGYVYYQGEIYEVPAATFTASGGQTAVGTIVTTYQTGDPVLFTDGNSHNVHEIRQLVFASAVSGSGVTDHSALKFYTGEDWTVDAGADATKTMYYKDSQGRVHLGGSLGTVSGLTSFTLPVGYRPLTQQRIPCMQFDFGAVDESGGIGYVQITTGGVVTHSDITGSGTARNAPLQGISFLAGQ